MISRFEQFTSAVSGISRSVQKIERTEMARFGLKGTQTQCLVALSHFPQGITAGELRDACNKDKAAVSRTVAELVELKLVERINPKGNHYRALLRLTEQGREIAYQVQERAVLAVDEASMGLSESQREALCQMLDMVPKIWSGSAPTV